jgi:hypothetical protein
MVNTITNQKFWRGNPNIPSSKTKERVSRKEYDFRVSELRKCKADICYFAEKYFYILSSDEGKHIINLYEKQKELLRLLTTENRLVILSSRQSFKTTTYTIFCLWLVSFFADKKILIVANKQKTSLEILQRIRFAYELLPSWVKPSVELYNRGMIQFVNNCSIEGEATSSNSARSKSASVLIVDEAARIAPNIINEFWMSSYPIISSGKNSKVIMVSTPNGVSGLYFDTYSTAKNVGEKKILGDWVRFRVDWWDVPTRDKEWKRQTLQSMSEEEFAQEFGNSFLSSSTPTLLPFDKIEQYRRFISSKLWFPPKQICIRNHKDHFIKQWMPARKDRTYIIAVDSAEGLQQDFSVCRVLDVTNTKNIIECATFSSNTTSIKDFTFIAHTMAIMYNQPFIISEKNGMNKAFLELITGEPYNYDNLVSISVKPGDVGVHSNPFIKNKAALWLRHIILKEDQNITLFDDRLVDEMPFFIQKGIKKHKSFSAMTGKHDDQMCTFLWAIYCIHPDVVEDYFQIVDEGKNRTGEREIYQLAQLNATTAINPAIISLTEQAKNKEELEQDDLDNEQDLSFDPDDNIIEQDQINELKSEQTTSLEEKYTKAVKEQKLRQQLGAIYTPEKGIKIAIEAGTLWEDMFKDEDEGNHGMRLDPEGGMVGFIQNTLDDLYNERQ